MEPFYNQYKDTLEELNKCIKSFGVPIYGNLFYKLNKISKMADILIEKRMDFCDFALNSDCIVEIGFNAGHSALLGLTANQDIIYRSVDVGQPYSEACYNILKSVFGDRISLTIGDSLDVIPTIKEIYPEIEGKKVGWFIDGDHSYEYCKQDLDNVLVFAKDDDLIFIDDTNQEQLAKLINEYLSNNIIRIVKKSLRNMIVARSG
jgi:hypothetical protein